jgi:hypothetical protein
MVNKIEERKKVISNVIGTLESKKDYESAMKYFHKVRTKSNNS